MSGVYLFRAGHPSVEWIDAGGGASVKARFGRELLAYDWKIPEIQRIDEYVEHSGKALPDFPYWGYDNAIYSDRAVVVLKDLLEPSCEILPLKCDEGHYWAVNVVITTRSLELHKCKCDFFPSTGGLWNIHVHHFHRSVLEGNNIFRLPTYAAPVCVLDKFVARCSEHQLTGCAFEQIWDATD